MNKYLRGGETINSDKRGYGNLAVYSPDDVLMFYANKNRLNFYLKNDLAEEIGENKFRLKFKPDGLGYSDPRSEYGGIDCLVPRENKCVVTGDTDMSNLSRHHIVPSFFRKHFPVKYKSNFQLIVLLRRDTHSDYTIEEHKFYDVLADKYGVPKWNTFACNINTRCKKLARSLFLYGNVIPEDKKMNMKLEFMHETGLNPTMDVLREYATSLAEERKIAKTPENDFGCAIAAKIIDYREFELLWLNHFVENAKPKYLPIDLIKSYGLEENIAAIAD